jgi:hypothetical protein
MWAVRCTSTCPLAPAFDAALELAGRGGFERRGSLDAEWPSGNQARRGNAEAIMAGMGVIMPDRAYARAAGQRRRSAHIH